MIQTTMAVSLLPSITDGPNPYRTDGVFIYSAAQSCRVVRDAYFDVFVLGAPLVAEVAVHAYDPTGESK